MSETTQGYSRMDIVGQNGNDGQHYEDRVARPEDLDKPNAPGLSARPTMADKYPAYHKDVRHLETVDVYRVHRLFKVFDPELHHASKKILLCGVRTGGKPARQEIVEARDTLNRWLEILDEDEKRQL